MISALPCSPLCGPALCAMHCAASRSIGWVGGDRIAKSVTAPLARLFASLLYIRTADWETLAGELISSEAARSCSSEQRAGRMACGSKVHCAMCNALCGQGGKD